MRLPTGSKPLVGPLMDGPGPETAGKDRGPYFIRNSILVSVLEPVRPIEYMYTYILLNLLKEQAQVHCRRRGCEHCRNGEEPN